MTADIRTAAEKVRVDGSHTITSGIRTAVQRDERVIREFQGDDVWRDEEGAIWVSQKQHNEMVLKAHAWGAARVTPTREQIAEALYNQEGAPLGTWSQVGAMQHGWLEGADAVLALMQELAEGER